MGILKEKSGIHLPRLEQFVAEGSIRLGILKGAKAAGAMTIAKSCRGLDPIGDTERFVSSFSSMRLFRVAEGSIRLGILKAI